MEMDRIDLISDTVTQPTPGMLEAMWKAPVGDDVFGEDPSLKTLEAYGADLFGMEAALFCPSGTMTNQIAIKVHTRPLDEVICDEYSHIYQYEVGGYAFHSGVAVNLLKGDRGRLTAAQVEAAIKAPYDWLPRTRLVVLENTCNKAGGSIYRLEQVQAIQEVCRKNGLKLHLDGARLFNALAETEEDPKDWGKAMDSISICLSKGLGAPVGSLLLGRSEFIREARRVRKAMGGGMRQAGYLGAAGLFALQHQVDRLKEDHHKAKFLGGVLESLDYIKRVYPVETNIILFDLEGGLSSASFLASLAKAGVRASAFGPQTIRMVTHLDFTTSMLEKVTNVLEQLTFPEAILSSVNP